MSATVRVPASVANLGPGYDCFALAVGVYDQYVCELADEWTISVEGECEGDVPLDEDNLVIRAMKRIFEEFGAPRQAARVECHCRIPSGRGLGSSASAVVAGVLAADVLVKADLGTEELYAMAAEMDGHGDNAAAAMYGGFCISWKDYTRDPEGAYRATPLQARSGLACVIVPSDAPLDTSVARDLVPEQVSTDDAVFNVGRAGLLVAALMSDSGDSAPAAFEDRLHEPHRRERIGDLGTVRRMLQVAGADGAVLAGAGPTVAGILLDVDDSSAFRRAVEVAGAAEELLGGLEGRDTPFAVPVDWRGASII
jgi:homoserine kinase